MAIVSSECSTSTDDMDYLQLYFSPFTIPVAVKREVVQT